MLRGPDSRRFVLAALYTRYRLTELFRISLKDLPEHRIATLSMPISVFKSSIRETDLLGKIFCASKCGRKVQHSYGRAAAPRSWDSLSDFSTQIVRGLYSGDLMEWTA